MAKGIFFGVAGAFCQAVGAAWSKVGMGTGEGSLSGLEASFMRLLVASLVGVALALANRDRQRWRRDLFARGVQVRIFPAAICGTYLGIWLSLLAYKNTSLAVATTLTSLTPVLVLPLVILFLRQRVSPRAL